MATAVKLIDKVVKSKALFLENKEQRQQLKPPNQQEQTNK